MDKPATTETKRTDGSTLVFVDDDQEGRYIALFDAQGQNLQHINLDDGETNQLKAWVNELPLSPGFYNHILFFSTMAIAERYDELLAIATELFLLLKDTEVLGHEARDDGDRATLQIQTSTPLNLDLQALINQTIDPERASYNVPHYEQWRNEEPSTIWHKLRFNNEEDLQSAIQQLGTRGFTGVQAENALSLLFSTSDLLDEGTQAMILQAVLCLNYKFNMHEESEEERIERRARYWEEEKLRTDSLPVRDW